MAHHLIASFGFVAVLCGFGIALAVYFLPLIIAIRRRAMSRVGVGLVNFLFGWTVRGWVA